MLEAEAEGADEVFDEATAEVLRLSMGRAEALDASVERRVRFSAAVALLAAAIGSKAVAAQSTPWAFSTLLVGASHCPPSPAARG